MRQIGLNIKCYGYILRNTEREYDIGGKIKKRERERTKELSHGGMHTYAVGCRAAGAAH